METVELERVFCKVEMVSGKNEQKWKAEWDEQPLCTGDGRRKWFASM